jgi:segregation and condensation protein A
VSPGESSDASVPGWSVQLPQFEGPLDLLLHLCQKHELNVLDIPVAFVTEKYLEHLAIMQLIELEVASEYLVMAATLVHIKSKMLLPAPPPEQEDELATDDGVDPREALIRRLLEYQKYKDAGERLSARGIAGRDVFTRGAAVAAESNGLPPLAEVSLFSLVDAFQRVLDRSKVKLSHEVIVDRISMTDRIQELTGILSARHRLRFEELFERLATVSELVITFLALLEMTRLRMTHLVQTEPLGPLFIEMAGSELDPAAETGVPPSAS